MARIEGTLGVTSLLAMACVSVAMAQETDACPAGQVEIGTIGIGELQCENCSFDIEIRADSGIGRRVWDFRSEPTIGRIVAGGPAAGRLRAGDVITAIDGQLITTREGGLRYGALVPGRDVTLGIRRDGQEHRVSITPVGECARVQVSRTPPKAPAAPRPAAVPRPTAPPTREVPPTAPTPEARPAAAPRPAPPPRPWPSTSALGFSIQCSECSLQRLRDPERWVWSFSESPVVERVEPEGAADDAGLRSGDILTAIDGHRLTSSEGGERFGTLGKGERITLTYRRGSSEHTATLVAREAAGWGVEVVPSEDVSLAVAPVAPTAERFSGSLGDVTVRVTGGRVSVTRTETEIVIQSSDVTVRIRRTGGEQ
jgi:membrane-associated protease RseP (regulator of RpoE activity)